MTTLRHPVLSLLAMASLAMAAETTPLVQWEVGPHPAGTPAAAGTVLEAASDGPARLGLPGTRSGHLLLAPGSQATVNRRAVTTKGETTEELVVQVLRGEVTVSGAFRPRFTGCRVRAGASETVLAGDGTLHVAVADGADTVTLRAGRAVAGPRPDQAGSWRMVSERIVLTPGSRFTADAQGVSETRTVPDHDGNAGATDPTQTLADTTPWSAPNTPATQDTTSPWSLLGQISVVRDTNPNRVAEATADAKPDTALTAFVDARWTCWKTEERSLQLQGIVGWLLPQGVTITDDLGTTHRSEDTASQQFGLNAAYLTAEDGWDWSLGLGGVEVRGDQERRTVVRTYGDLGMPVGNDGYAALTLGWARSAVHPAEGPYHSLRTITLRPSYTAIWPGDDWTSRLEWSLLYTDSHSADPVDRYAGLRPGVAWLNSLGRLDLALVGRAEYIAYRAARTGPGTDLGRDVVTQVSASGDWWFQPWWSVGGFVNHLRFTSNLPDSDYAQVQAGARTTFRW